MRWLFFYLLVVLSIGVQAQSKDTKRLETRYGTMSVAGHADFVDIVFGDDLVRSFEALDASLYRVTPQGQREFVIVDVLTPGLNCHHVFVLVELHSYSNAMVSEPFGECKELQGVEFHGESPVIRLREPDISGRRKSLVSSDFEWRNGKIVELSGTVGTKAPNACATAGTVKDSSSPDNSIGRIYRVASPGRLQFLSAPSPGCEQGGVFVVSGDTVRGYQHVGLYTFVRYVNPKSAKSVEGWVISSRLVETGAP